jgi:hypothetical protein
MLSGGGKRPRPPANDRISSAATATHREDPSAGSFCYNSPVSRLAVRGVLKRRLSAGGRQDSKRRSGKSAMKIGCLPLMRVLPPGSPSGPRSLFDVPSPPTGLLVGMSLAALVALGLFVAAVVVAAILAIRAVRKNIASKKEK